MSVISLNDYLIDHDCPELIGNANFTFIAPKDAELDPETYSNFLAYGDTCPD
jgi:hypothetical protein